MRWLRNLFSSVKTKAILAKIGGQKSTMLLMQGTLQIAILQQKRQEDDLPAEFEEVKAARSMVRALTLTSFESVDTMQKQEQNPQWEMRHRSESQDFIRPAGIFPPVAHSNNVQASAGTRASQREGSSSNSLRSQQARNPASENFMMKRARTMDDSTTWLYWLVFSQTSVAAQSASGNERFSAADVATEQVVTQLLVKWTNAQPQVLPNYSSESEDWRDQLKENAEHLIAQQQEAVPGAKTRGPTSMQASAEDYHSEEDTFQAPEGRSRSEEYRRGQQDYAGRLRAEEANKRFFELEREREEERKMEILEFERLREKELIRKKVELERLREKIQKENLESEWEDREKTFKTKLKLKMLEEDLQKKEEASRKKDERERVLLEHDREIARASVDRERLVAELKAEMERKEEERRSIIKVTVAKEQQRRKNKEIEEKAIIQRSKMQEKEEIEKEEAAEQERLADAVKAAKVMHVPQYIKEDWDLEGAVFLLGLTVQRREKHMTRKDNSRHIVDEGILCSLLWLPPVVSGLSELYSTLVARQWRPVWMRGNSQGETWYLGYQPVASVFFSKTYKPQVDLLDIKEDVTVDTESENRSVSEASKTEPEDSFVAIDKGLIDAEVLEMSGWEPFEEDLASRWRLPSEVTGEDIEHMVATTFFLREQRQRRAVRRREDPLRYALRIGNGSVSSVGTPVAESIPTR